MSELYETLEDLDSKLDNLALIRFCRDRAEKYLARVTEKVYNINLLLISNIINKKQEPLKEDKNNEIFMQEIDKLNKKINELEVNLAKENTEKKVIKKEPPNYTNLLIEAFKCYLGVHGI
jgi:hypothetical protein